jgi:hypothetical protein
MTSRRIPERAMLVIAALVVAAFFACFCSRNTAPVRHDMGLALGLAFAVPVLFYASLGSAGIAALAALVAAIRRRACRLWLVALGISLLPLVYFLLLDPRW